MRVGQLNTRYLRGTDPDQVRRDLLARVRSSPQRTSREIDNRVNLRWFLGQPWWYRSPGSGNKIIGMNPTARRNFLFPNLLRDIVRTLSGVMYYEPDVDAFPATSDPGDIVRAETDQHIARHLIQDGGLPAAFRSAMEMSNLYGDGYIKVLWNPDAGARRPLVHTEVCPTCSNQELQQTEQGLMFRGAGVGSGAIITDYGLQSCFNCSAQGVVDGGEGRLGPLGHITQYMGTAPEGDVEFQAVHPDDVYVDPDATRFDEAEELAHRIRLSPERAWSRYGRALDIPQDFFEQLPPDAWDNPGFAQMRDGRPGDSRYLAVTEYYRRPSEKHPEGLFTVSVNDQTIYADSIPYLHDRHWNPLFRFPMYETEGWFYGQGTADIALPLVLAYADQFSAAHFRAKESARMRWMVPDSVGIRHNDDTGNVHYKDKPSSPKPEPVTLGSVPADVSEMRDQLLMLLDRVSGASEILRGAAAGAESGVAMTLLEERALGPLRPVISTGARTLDAAIRYALEVAKLHYEDGRLIRMLGINGSMQVKEFRVEDNGMSADVRLRAVRDVGRSRASKMQELNDAADRQMVDPETYRDLAEFGDLKGVWAEEQPHRNMAVQEHETLYRTGDIQQPLPTEKHRCHIKEHGKELNSIKSRDPNSPLIPILLQHVAVHEQMEAQKQIQSQMYQQQAMSQLGQINAANPDFQPASTQDQLAQGPGGASSSPAAATPASEPFVNENSGLGEQASYAAAGSDEPGLGGF